MTTLHTLPKGALQPLPDDARDFALLGGVFEVPKLENLPNEFYDAELIGVKDQGALDFCAGFASSEVSEDQECIELDPHYAFMSAKRLLGGDAWKTYGCNLRDMAQAAVKAGFIEATHFPFLNDDRASDRDFLANPENWPADLDLLAADHKKGSFWDAITGPYDKFDNLRAAIWMNRYEHRSVMTGALWRQEWTDAEGGVVPKEYDSTGEGHAFKAFGWKTIDGEPYLVIVNSWGPEAGDGGLFYFPREVVNKEFTFGAYTYKDMVADDAKVYIDTGIVVTDNSLTKLWKVFVSWIQGLFTR